MARAAALGAARETAVLRQVHGRRVALFRAGGEAFPARSLEGDGAATDRAGLVLAIRVADCLPVFLADREGRAAALLHAGWRGLAAGIVEEGLAALARLGAAPERLVAWIGPSVGPCCYEVGGEVIRAFRGAARTINGGEEKPRLDLYETARAILLRAGVDPERIDRRPPCTACAPHRFHSHRAHPEKGGRNLALLFLDR